MPVFSLIIGIVLVVLLLLVASIGYLIGQFVWAIACIYILRLIRPEGQRAKWLFAIIPLFIPIYIACITAVVWSQWPDKSTAYEIAFDMPVSQSVTIYSGEISGWGDWESIELHFNATPADIKAITARGLTLNPQHATNAQNFNFAAQSPVPLSNKDIYTGGSPNQRFSTVDEAVLIYDPATGDAWYWYEGLD